MGSRLLRALLAVATFTVVWLVVTPASAMSAAPMCDPRGAITFAPPPQFQDPELSLDIPADCVDLSPLDTHNVVPGRAATPDLRSSQEPVATDTLRLTTLNFTVRLPIADVTILRLSPGVRSSLDRPPRS